MCNPNILERKNVLNKKPYIPGTPKTFYDLIFFVYLST